MKKIIAIVFLALLSCFLILNYLTNSSRSKNETSYTFIINSGDNLLKVGENLAKENLISNRWFFYYYMWKEKLRGEIVAGEYLIKPNISIAEITLKITKGDAKIKPEESIKVTFPEGWTIEKMAQRLKKNNLPADDFRNLANNPTDEILTKYAFIPEGKTLEGFLFPDTYIFTVDATAEEIIDKMLANFDSKVTVDMRDKLATEDKNLYDILTFASIIEGEVSKDEDRGLVAGVFKNRLDIGMPLQSDATIDYIKGGAEVKHTLADLEIDSPYNTYKYNELPPAPINNPSLASIKSAISPTETEFMYFLNNAETGETVFSKTFDEHVNNKGKHGL